MTWLRLAWANLSLAPLSTLVNIVLMALGTASIVLLLLAGTQLREVMSRDAKGIDLVLGAPGSPVQLVLSAVYHADIPPGNIVLADAQRWAEDPRIKRAIPLSLGDSYRGSRIVGTETSYVDLYNATLAHGRMWAGDMEAVVGHAVAREHSLAIGSAFAGAHGLGSGAHDHESQAYRVVGVLAPTGTVIDRLVVTSLRSVWRLHGLATDDADHTKHDTHDMHDEPHEHHSETDDHADHDGQAHDAHEHAESHSEQVTAMLLQYRSPLAAVSLPREINASGAIQAAAPALEIARILQLLGVGLQALGAFAWVLVATAALSIFAALYGSLRARRGELAMLRCLGANRAELFFYLMAEGLLLALMGIALGFVMGHALTELVGSWLGSSRGVEMTGWTWVSAEFGVLLGLIGAGLLSALVPGVQAYRTDVATALVDG